MSSYDLSRLALPPGWRDLSLVVGEPRLHESPTSSQLLGVVEDVEGRQYGVGVWSREGQLQHFWNEAQGATWVATGQLLLAHPRVGSVVYERIDSRGGELLDRLCVDGPTSVAGMVLSTAADGRHSGVEMFDGQGGVGYSILRVESPLQRVVHLEYTDGDSNLDGVAFSHDGQRAAWAVRHGGIWWCPGDLDAEYDTPSPGGVIDWAWLYLATLTPPCTVRRVALTTLLTKGWTPQDQWKDAGPPAAVTFTREGRVRMRVPWSGGVEFDMGPAQSLMVPGPRMET